MIIPWILDMYVYVCIHFISVATGARCHSKQFLCESDKVCIPMEQRCNKHPDCIDGSDERNCQYGEAELVLFSGHIVHWHITPSSILMIENTLTTDESQFSYSWEKCGYIIYIDVCSLSTFNREYLIKKTPKVCNVLACRFGINNLINSY